MQITHTVHYDSDDQIKNQSNNFRAGVQVMQPPEVNVASQPDLNKTANDDNLPTEFDNPEN